MSKPVLQIIVGSTRPGRVGLPVARWFEGVAVEHAAFDVELVDLAEVALPMFDEAVHPILRQYEQDHAIEWAETIRRGDAFVFVHPEYNHSFNAALKNAIDYLHSEWSYKPVGFVSYGGVSAGTRAVQALKPVVAALRMTPAVEAVAIPFVTQFIDEDGRFVPNELLTQAAAGMLAELVRLDAVLHPLRTPELARLAH